MGALTLSETMSETPSPGSLISPGNPLYRSDPVTLRRVFSDQSDGPSVDRPVREMSQESLPAAPRNHGASLEEEYLCCGS